VPYWQSVAVRLSGLNNFMPNLGKAVPSLGPRDLIYQARSLGFVYTASAQGAVSSVFSGYASWNAVADRLCLLDPEVQPRPGAITTRTFKQVAHYIEFAADATAYSQWV
jgi:hypothetical protein